MNEPVTSNKKGFSLGIPSTDEEHSKHLEIIYLRKKIKSWLLALFTFLTILSLIVSVWLWFIFKNTMWMWASGIWLLFLLFAVSAFSDTNSKGE